MRGFHIDHPLFGWSVSMQAKLKNSFQFVKSDYVGEFGFATNPIQNGMEKGCFRILLNICCMFLLRILFHGFLFLFSSK